MEQGVSGDYEAAQGSERMTASSEYTPCVAVWPSGRTQRGNVRYTRLDSVESARAKLAAGKVAWVRPADVERVLAARGEAGADGAVD